MPLNKLNKGEINELRLARSPKERPVSLFKSGNILKPRDLRSLEKGSLTCGWSHQVNFKESKLRHSGLLNKTYVFRVVFVRGLD